MEHLYQKKITLHFQVCTWVPKSAALHAVNTYIWYHIWLKKRNVVKFDWLFIYLFITFRGNQANPNSANALNLRDASMKCFLKQIYSRSPVLDAGEKTGGPGENLRKQVWTGNQMHIRCRDWESNPGPLVHSAGEEPLRYLLPLNNHYPYSMTNITSIFKCYKITKILY